MGLFDGMLGGGERASEERAREFANEQQQTEITATRNRDIYNTALQDAQDGYVQEQKSNLIKWQQELDDDIVNLIHQLKGHKLREVNADGSISWFVPEKPQPICNDLFIEQVVIPHCKAYMSRNQINSNFTEDRLLLFLRATFNDISSAMADGHDKYGILFIDFDIVLRLIKEVIVPGAFRSIAGWTKRTDSTIYKNIESTNLAPPREKKEERRFFG